MIRLNTIAKTLTMLLILLFTFIFAYHSYVFAEELQNSTDTDKVIQSIKALLNSDNISCFISQTNNHYYGSSTSKIKINKKSSKLKIDNYFAFSKMSELFDKNTKTVFANLSSPDNLVYKYDFQSYIDSRTDMPKFNPREKFQKLFINKKFYTSEILFERTLSKYLTVFIDENSKFESVAKIGSSVTNGVIISDYAGRIRDYENDVFLYDAVDFTISLNDSTGLPVKLSLFFPLEKNGFEITNYYNSISNSIVNESVFEIPNHYIKPYDYDPSMFDYIPASLHTKKDLENYKQTVMEKNIQVKNNNLSDVKVSITFSKQLQLNELINFLQRYMITPFLSNVIISNNPYDAPYSTQLSGEPSTYNRQLTEFFNNIGKPVEKNIFSAVQGSIESSKYIEAVENAPEIFLIDTTGDMFFFGKNEEDGLERNANGYPFIPTLDLQLKYLNDNTSRGLGQYLFYISFNDISASHWAYSYILQMYRMGIFNGYPDNTFLPDKNITRAEFAKVLETSFNPKYKSYYDFSFSDVKPDDWFYPYAYALKDYINFFTDKNNYYFKPSSPALRKEVAKALIKICGYDVSKADVNILKSKFSDYNAIPDDYKEYIALAVEKNIIQGYTDNTFRPDGMITRAEMCALLSRLIQ